MSFSKELKKEISEIESLSNKKAVEFELKGYLISSNILIKNKFITYRTENEYNINRFSKLLSNLNINDYNIKLQGKKYIIIIKEKNIEKYQNIDTVNIGEDDIKCIIRGVYLGSGSINNPQKEYHLQIGIRKKEDVKKLIELLKLFQIKGHIINQKKEYLIYIKEGEEISRFLALIGANKSVLKFEEIRVQRDMNNKINRIVNCESANLNKTINASIEQIEAIKKIKENKKFEKMNDTLKEIAEMRLKYPNASLIELGQMLKNPIGKSGVNYRLKKILEIANE